MKKNEIRICDKCKGFNYQNIIKSIKELDNNANIMIGCQNFCGIGRTKAFIILNNIPIIADNETELLIKIKEKITLH